MELVITVMLLLAAVMHATWSTLLKLANDKLQALALMHLAGILIAGVVLPFAAPVASSAWPYLLSSAAVHIVHSFLMIRAYGHGDLSQVHPLARGIPPLVVVVLAAIFASEYLSVTSTAGVALIAGSVIFLAVGGPARASLITARPALLACVAGVLTAVYTLLDGLGARASGAVLAYACWIFVLSGVPLLIAAVALNRRDLGSQIRHFGARHGVAGLLVFCGYAIAVWAMSVGTIAHAAALRETSVIFTALIGTLYLKESFGRVRIIAAAAVVIGVVLLNLPDVG